MGAHADLVVAGEKMSALHVHGLRPEYLQDSSSLKVLGVEGKQFAELVFSHQSAIRK